MGSTSLNNLEAAAVEFRLAKTKDLPEDRALHFGNAARLWNGSVLYCRGNPEEAAKLCRNLILTHIGLATAALEVSDSKTAQYHISECSVQAAKRSGLLGEDEGTWAFTCRRLVQALDGRSVTSAMWAEAFWCFSQVCHHPAAQIARCTALRIYLAKSVQRAIMLVNDKGYPQLASLFAFGRPRLGEPMPDEIQAWVVARQQIARAMVCLADAKKEGLTIAELAEFDEEFVDSLVEQASFLSHRASILLRLHSAYRLATEVLMETETYNHHDALEVLDEFRAVTAVAIADGDAPSGLDGSKMDAEMACIALSHLGSCYQRLGLIEQQARCLRECVELALSMDAAFVGNVDGLIGECTLPPQQLRTQPWFVAALDFLKKRQEARQQHEQAAYRQRMDLISEHVSEMRTHIDSASLIRHLFSKYKIAGKTCPVPEDAVELTRKQLMSALLTYSPDKQQEGNLPGGWTLSYQSWVDFSTEASKRLTAIYEAEFK